MEDNGSQWQKINDKLDEIARRLTRLETLSETEADRCKYVPDIVNARQLARLVDRIETRVTENTRAIRTLEVSWSKLIGLMIGSGVLGGTLSNILVGLFQ
jgi:hypothetical protein